MLRRRTTRLGGFVGLAAGVVLAAGVAVAAVLILSAAVTGNRVESPGFPGLGVAVVPPGEGCPEAPSQEYADVASAQVFDDVTLAFKALAAGDHTRGRSICLYVPYAGTLSASTANISSREVGDCGPVERQAESVYYDRVTCRDGMRGELDDLVTIAVVGEGCPFLEEGRRVTVHEPDASVKAAQMNATGTDVCRIHPSVNPARALDGRAVAAQTDRLEFDLRFELQLPGGQGRRQ